MALSIELKSGHNPFRFEGRVNREKIPESSRIREPEAPFRAGIGHLCKKLWRRLFNQVKERESVGTALRLAGIYELHSQPIVPSSSINNSTASLGAVPNPI